MRMARIKISGRIAVYHCISRIVGGQFLLGDLEKDKLAQHMRQQADFSGLEIITFCVLSNHIHILLRVPAVIDASDAELVARALKFYGSESLYVQTLQSELAKLGQLPEDLRKGLLRRMGDVSVFMKELKQRFSKWYNGLHDRFGTLWAERFKSLLVEDLPSAVLAVAAYIDLNALRARLVGDPKDYRWCGYGEALAGKRVAQHGLASIYGTTDWATASCAYRQVLLTKAGQTGNAGQRVMDPETIRRELARGGKLTLSQVLQIRVRYFVDGVALGSRDYVNEVFHEFRTRFGARRTTGARPLRGLSALKDLFTLRDLRLDRVG